MKRFIISLSMLLVFAFGGAHTTFADTPAQHKIGVVNLRKVFEGYDKQKELYAQLEEEKNVAQKPINELSSTIEADRAHYRENEDTMTNEEKADLEEKVENNISLYQSEFKRLQAEIDRKEKRVLEELFGDIQKAIEEIGARENYHLVFEGDEKGRRSGVLYFSTTLNMTQKVVEHLNSK